MLAPVHRLTKKEILWLAKNRCKHRHTYLEHYECYKTENPLNDRIGFFDIETSNLKPDYGIMFCYCIKDGSSNNIYSRTLTNGELRKHLDKGVVEQLVNDLSKFTKIVTYYGTKFDLTFSRSRAAYHNIPFPEYGQLNHTDVYYIVKHKFNLSRNRLESACRLILGEAEKNHIDAIFWLKALQGDKESLDYITDHCKRDVRDLEKLYNRIIGFSKPSEKSI